MILPSYVGIILNHYKDLYKPISVTESNEDFFVPHFLAGWWCFPRVAGTDFVQK